MKKIAIGSICDCIENQNLFYDKNIHIVPFVGDQKDWCILINFVKYFDLKNYIK